ncbi:MAG: M67 family metallopeptidase [Desulfobulbaceae bacterium]|nr:M67 family metallopeptidase [Desulfobulbaceae bacterium]
MILLSYANLMRVYSHAQATGSDECCGALLGIMSDIREVKRVVALRNMAKKNPQWNYMVLSDELLQLEKEAMVEGLDVVGFYHSHPYGTPVPSSVDLQMAWPGYSYFIVGRDPGALFTAKSWVLQLDGQGFKEQELVVI